MGKQLDGVAAGGGAADVLAAAREEMLASRKNPFICRAVVSYLECVLGGVGGIFGTVTAILRPDLFLYVSNCISGGAMVDYEGMRLGRRRWRQNSMRRPAIGDAARVATLAAEAGDGRARELLDLLSYGKANLGFRARNGARLTVQKLDKWALHRRQRLNLGEEPDAERYQRDLVTDDLGFWDVTREQNLGLRSDRPNYDSTVITKRRAWYLARMHRYRSVRHLAGSLPANARVLDLGAGKSNLGAAVAARRADVTWINVDLAYRYPSVAETVKRHSLPNLHHVAADVTQLSNLFPAESFDAVYSYWLFPHLSIDGDTVSEAAAGGIFDVLKPGGVATIGPWIRRPQRRSKRWEKTPDLTGEMFASEVFAATRFVGPHLHRQRVTNERATRKLRAAYYGTKLKS